jgi:ABC-type branched-subunit amino acid transport system ATPase component
MELAAHGVGKAFGGLTALADVSLAVAPGEVHGLIGPNGSGKTTLLNLMSGFYTADSGRITLGQVDITRDTVQRRAFTGIARTFQKPRLLPALSVLDNAMLGGWHETRATFVGTALSWLTARRDEKRLRIRAEEILCGVGLAHAIGRRAALLEHAEQRFLEIARGLMARPRFLLLDEPAGGLTPHEIDQLGVVVNTVRRCGIGVLLVEHHTDFVFRNADRVTALDLGRVVRQGSPEEVRNDPEVIRVYLGA